MRYMYVLIVMTAMAFVAAGAARGDGNPPPPSGSCPPHYTWDNKKGACVPRPCPKGEEWDKKKGKCTKED